MDKKQFIETCNRKIKLIRAEYSFSQDKMALILGISKKTLVEIEKGRSSLGWTGSVALCAIFGESEIVTGAFGGKPAEIILALAFDGSEPLQTQSKPALGKIWWQSVRESGGYLIQQNVISQHYRLLDREGTPVASSFDLEDLKIPGEMSAT